MGKISSSLEDYLEAIYIIESKNKVARITDIAQHLNISKPSVTKALKLLAERDLINYEPYKYITLKGRGIILARKILNKHKALKLFCDSVLYISEEDSDEIACQMEHFVSCENLQKFLLLIEFFQEHKDCAKLWRDKAKSAKNEKLNIYNIQLEDK
ncbi:MAG: metal-dependent transcriptional regulator [Candidatus Cloacimonadaceae bacterium]|jgi:DtxR family Mn-dependent transcriptional regulator|nr:metal-dependent transcriptional regulator [Candidatus Cloacimonadota bacterium]MDY0126908.1 metal-dependent transcriptional regulator [Candidatus Cloacimonadaceae bacterium]MCB5255302.1 metal-dependent transcriptional regulator [Candidatus Cloacimonadota bacterium]MCK9178737.1 metal-dependent transcriptional regulator [Candidatus Cloacimonadota bacterium]MCK9242424.1 metal-dependent transcriptional regulator [Candidatus Cloacimonadota bacterium]